MPADEAAFVSLADLLRARPLTVDSAALALPVVRPTPAGDSAASASAFSSDRAVPAESRLPPEPDIPTEPVTTDLAASGSPPPGGCAEPASVALAVREAKLFRAAVADAFDVLLPSLARELARDVFGRELRLAAVDLETLARRLVAERLAQGPLRLRVAPADAHVACELPLTVDPSLEPGDAVLECRSGDIDARLKTRLAAVLETADR